MRLTATCVLSFFLLALALPAGAQRMVERYLSDPVQVRDAPGGPARPVPASSLPTQVPASPQPDNMLAIQVDGRTVLVRERDVRLAPLQADAAETICPPGTERRAPGGGVSQGLGASPTSCVRVR